MVKPSGHELCWHEMTCFCTQAWKHAWQSIDEVDKVFSCGRFKDQDIFVARQACKGKFFYYICAFAE